MFHEERITKASEEVEKIIALTGIKGKKILDMCCGPGRHAVALALKGYTVTGVDLSDFLLGKAIEYASINKVGVEWVKDDMRRFKRYRFYDLVINMYTAFGYFDDKNDDMAALACMYGCLNDGGMLLIDMTGKEKIARKLQPTTSHRYPDGALLIERHKVYDEWSRLKNEWILMKNGKIFTYAFHHTIYSGQEIKERLLRTGFSEVKIYGSLDGLEYGPMVDRLVAVARK